MSSDEQRGNHPNDASVPPRTTLAINEGQAPTYVSNAGGTSSKFFYPMPTAGDNRMSRPSNVAGSVPSTLAAAAPLFLTPLVAAGVPSTASPLSGADQAHVPPPHAAPLRQPSALVPPPRSQLNANAPFGPPQQPLVFNEQPAPAPDMTPMAFMSSSSPAASAPLPPYGLHAFRGPPPPHMHRYHPAYQAPPPPPPPPPQQHYPPSRGRHATTQSAWRPAAAAVTAGGVPSGGAAPLQSPGADVNGWPPPRSDLRNVPVRFIDPRATPPALSGRPGHVHYHRPLAEREGPPPRYSTRDDDRAPVAPVERARPAPQPDPELLATFERQYAAQEDEEVVLEHLQQQKISSNGVTGTLDVDACLRIIEDHDVSFIVTDTGTGKSTLIPQALCERCPESVIVNAQPRRTSCINLAHRVSKLIGAPIGTTVGYSVRGEHAGEIGSTRVMYVTNYTLLLSLIWNAPEEMSFTHIIVDEFHELTAEVEVLVLLLKALLYRFPRKFKLILCSASAQVDYWSAFFKDFSVGQYNQANAMYPIHEYYLEDICKLSGLAFVPDPPAADNTVGSLQLHKSTLYVEKMLEFLAGVGVPQHSILVFLPGRTPVENLTKWVLKNLGDRLDPIPWYRDVDLAHIQAAIQREALMKKKVYIATNIAEVSLTIPDLVFVVDSGMAKRLLINEKDANSIAFPHLQTFWEGPMSLQQRRGRVGRVKQGFYFSVLSRAQSQQLQGNDSHIANTVLHDLVLHCLHITTRPFALFSLCFNKPRVASVNYSLLTLCEGGYIFSLSDPLAPAECLPLHDNKLSSVASEKATLQWHDVLQTLDTAAGDRGSEAEAAGGSPMSLQNPFLSELAFQLTMKGFVVGHLPVALEAATVAYQSIIFGVPALGIIAAAVEDTKIPFYVPYDKVSPLEKKRSQEAVSAMMQTYKGELQSDIISSVGVVLDYMDMQRDGLSDDAQNAWCDQRYVSRTRLVDIVNLVRQICEQLKGVVGLVDIENVDALKAQYDQHAPLLKILAISAHLHRAMLVVHDRVMSQRKKFGAVGIFFPLKCISDFFVPSVCSWSRSAVCVPFSLQSTYERLLAAFTTQLTQGEFNIAAVLFSTSIAFAVSPTQPDVYYLEVKYMNSTQVVVLDRLTASQVLQLRRMQCASMRLMRRSLFHQSNPHAAEAEGSTEDERVAARQFGIPYECFDDPVVLPALLLSALKTLYERLAGAAEGNGVVCRISLAAELPAHMQWMRSVLVCSSNGIVEVAQEAPSPSEKEESEEDSTTFAAEFDFS